MPNIRLQVTAAVHPQNLAAAAPEPGRSAAFPSMAGFHHRNKLEY
jgi:hypothetical protein